MRPPIHDTFANHVVQAGIDLALEGEENAAGFRLGREHWELNIFELEDMSARAVVDNIQDRRGAANVTVGKRKRKREYVSIAVYYPQISAMCVRTLRGPCFVNTHR